MSGWLLAPERGLCGSIEILLHRYRLAERESGEGAGRQVVVFSCGKLNFFFGEFPPFLFSSRKRRSLQRKRRTTEYSPYSRSGRVESSRVGRSRFSEEGLSPSAADESSAHRSKVASFSRGAFCVESLSCTSKGAPGATIRPSRTRRSRAGEQPLCRSAVFLRQGTKQTGS